MDVMKLTSLIFHDETLIFHDENKASILDELEYETFLFVILQVVYLSPSLYTL